MPRPQSREPGEVAVGCSPFAAVLDGHGGMPGVSHRIALGAHGIGYGRSGSYQVRRDRQAVGARLQIPANCHRLGQGARCREDTRVGGGVRCARESADQDTSACTVTACCVEEGNDYSCIENLVGTKFDDRLAGDVDDNQIEGRRTIGFSVTAATIHCLLVRWRQTLRRTGDGVLFGNDGADFIDGETGSQMVSFAYLTDGVTVTWTIPPTGRIRTLSWPWRGSAESAGDDESDDDDTAERVPGRPGHVVGTGVEAARAVEPVRVGRRRLRHPGSDCTAVVLVPASVLPDN